MRNKNPITLIITERDKNLEISLDYNYTKALSIIKEDNSPPRIKGFKDPIITESKLLESMCAITQSDDNLEIIATISDYLKQSEKTIDSYINDLQKIVRKMIITSETKKVASNLRTRLIKQEQPNRSETPLNKKTTPRAKCIKCQTFYPNLPDDCICTSCGGHVQNELRPNTWFECQVCNGTGYNARFRKVCSSCNEQGWLFYELFKM